MSADYVLTSRQEEALAIIRRAVRQQGRPPTVRELMISLGGRSPSVAQQLLRQLELKGYIVREQSPYGRSSRNIRLTALGSAAE
jgi:SOS-response transcriptional repressor LexA